MIDGLKPYPAMKDSGVPWLGEVPEHWEIQRAKTLFRPVDVRSESGFEELLTVSSNNGVVPRRSANVTMFKAESYAGHKLCWPGDLVINSLWAWSRGLGVSRHHGIVSTAYGVYRTRDTNALEPRFVHELVRSSPFHWELRVRSKGVWTSRLQLTDESFLGAPFPLPPLPEQAAIVRFLDHADRRIRRYIRAKQKLIKLLEEQKQAIIHRAVTRGLDPNVTLKPSGVEWLGDVPEHWEVRRLKTMCSMKSGDGITATSIEPIGEYPVYGGNGIRGYTNSYTHDGDFALVGRQGALCGNVHVASGRFWASEHAVVVALRPGFNLSWFAALLRVMNLNQYSIAAAQPGLAVERVLNLSVPAPTMSEQSRMATHLEASTEELSEAIERSVREIDLLREYRTGLIADVVTGKLDVREAAARLPDEAEEPEPLDEIGSEGDADEAGANDADEVPEEAKA